MNKYVVAKQEELYSIEVLEDEISKAKRLIKEKTDAIIHNISEVLFDELRPEIPKPEQFMGDIPVTRRFTEIGTRYFDRDKFCERHQKLYDMAVSDFGTDCDVDDEDVPNPVYAGNKYIPVYIEVIPEYVDGKFKINIGVDLGYGRDFYSFEMIGEDKFSLFENRTWKHSERTYTMSEIIEFLRWYVDNSKRGYLSAQEIVDQDFDDCFVLTNNGEELV